MSAPGRMRKIPGGALEAWYTPFEEGVMREVAEASAASGLHPGDPLREAKVLHWLKAELDATIERDDPADGAGVRERRPVDAKTYLPPNAGAPETGRAAAARVYPKSGTQRRTVMDLIAGAGSSGMTDWELEVATGWKHQSVSATRNGLMRDGWVRDSGLRRVTDTGSEAVAWEAVA